MPDHLHALLEGTGPAADFRRMMMLFKQASTHQFRRTTGESLWASGYYEHVLRDDEATIEVALYVLGNPVRAGLVKKMDDYAYSGSDVLSLADVAAG